MVSFTQKRLKFAGSPLVGFDNQAKKFLKPIYLGCCSLQMLSDRALYIVRRHVPGHFWKNNQPFLFPAIKFPKLL